MKKDSRASYFSVITANRRLLKVPVYTGGTLLISGVTAAYYQFYSQQKNYRSTNVYKEGLEHLKSYEPVGKYVGVPYRVGWVKEADVRLETVMMVVPFRGAKGKANLIIHGRRPAGADSLEPELDHLDIELLSPISKTWTFYCRAKSGTSV